MSMTQTSPIAIGRWENEREYGAQKVRRYIFHGATRGFVESLGMFAVVATVYDNSNQRHRAPFRDTDTAKQWVEDNVGVGE
jgi:hypothetical protein